MAPPITPPQHTPRLKSPYVSEELSSAIAANPVQPLPAPLPASCPRRDASRSVSFLRCQRCDKRLMKLLETRCSPCYIADMFKDLKTNQTQAKLEEIEAMSFGFLNLVLRRPVKQDIMDSLAKAYNTETSTLLVDHGNICIKPELF
ncbi:hypothetical protein AHAS_Ahas16G0140300 [Arachis hypogaea]